MILYTILQLIHQSKTITSWSSPKGKKDHGSQLLYCMMILILFQT